MGVMDGLDSGVEPKCRQPVSSPARVPRTEGVAQPAGVAPRPLNHYQGDRHEERRHAGPSRERVLG